MRLCSLRCLNLIEAYVIKGLCLALLIGERAHFMAKAACTLDFSRQLHLAVLYYQTAHGIMLTARTDTRDDIGVKGLQYHRVGIAVGVMLEVFKNEWQCLPLITRSL